MTNRVTERRLSSLIWARRSSVRRLGTLALALALTCVASAAAAESRVAVVNISTLLREAPQARDANKRLNSEFAPRREELTECGEDIQAAERRLKKDGQRMDDLGRKRLVQKLSRQRRDCSRLQDEVRDDYNQRRNEELKDLQKLVNQIVADIADKRGLDVVLTEPAVLFVDDKVDLTDEVLDELERRSDARRGER